MVVNKHSYSVGDVILIKGYDVPIEIIELIPETEYIGYDLNKPKTNNNDWNFPQSDIIGFYKSNDPINPNHYKTNSIECIEIAELFPYTLGNAIKYAWRAGLKDDLIQDLNKCLWYLDRAIANGDDFVDEKVFGLARRKFNQVDSNEFKRYRHHYAILQCLILTDVEQAKEYLNQAIQYLQDAPD